MVSVIGISDLNSSHSWKIKNPGKNIPRVTFNHAKIESYLALFATE